MNTEKTVVIAKHDAVARGLMGEIIKRIERVGLKLIALEFIQSTQEMGDSHYPRTDEWLTKVGNRTLEEYQKKGIDAVAELGTADAKEIGLMVKKWNVEYLTKGPVLAMIWEGPGAVMIVRKLIGDTRPAYAAPGTIRGDFGLDNPEIANYYQRPMYNLVHASGEVAEAEEEIALWFSRAEIIDYKTYSNYFVGTYGKLE